MEKERRAARWRRRRLIFNNDGNDVIDAREGVERAHDVEEALVVRRGGELIGDFLGARIKTVTGTQVDSNWYASCMAGLTFSHHTKLGGFYGKGIPQELVDTYSRDCLQIQVDHSHQHGMEGFWSLRMNDAHDSYPMGMRRWTYGLAPFKRDHPQYMMGEPEDWERCAGGPRQAWSHLDFDLPQVREHVFALIEEVYQGYDVDGVELDFLRSSPYFRESLDGLPVAPEHLDLLTELVRRVRQTADAVGRERGRPLLLAVRAPFTADAARFIGLDLERWLSEDLVDILVAGYSTESVLTDSFREIVDLGHQYDVPVYPCIQYGFNAPWVFLDLGAEHRTFDAWQEKHYGGQPDRIGYPSFTVTLNTWQGSLAAWRAAAMNLFNAGADGIYTFNAFFAADQIWNEIGDPNTMAGKDKIYGVARFEGDSGVDKTIQLALTPGKPVSTAFQVGEDLTSAGAPELRFRLHLWDTTDVDELEVKLNDRPLPDLQPAGDDPTSGASWQECRLDASQVRRGENRVELLLRKRADSIDTSLVLDAVQLHVSYEGSNDGI